MPNNFVTLQEIARNALPRLMENLVFPNLIHQDFSGEFASKLGDTIQVRKPVVLSASEFNATSGVVPQDIVESTVPVTLDKIATVDVEVTALQGALNINDWSRQFIEPAVVALAEKINSDGLSLYKDLFQIAGAAGTAPKDLTDLAKIRQTLNEGKVPVSPRRAIWNPEADANFTTIPAIVNAEKSGTTAALREGSIGRVFGLENYMAQGIKTHTPAVAGTETKVTGNVNAGATTLGVTGTTLTGKFVKGDVLTIAGKQYVVTEESAAAAANAIAGIKVYPALPAIAANTPVTIVTADYAANMAFHPMAFTFVTRPLVKPAGVESYVTSFNNLSLRVTRGYDMKYKKEMISMDILYGYKTIYPELGMVYMG